MVFVKPGLFAVGVHRSLAAGEPEDAGERLYWDSSYALALRLMEAHPQVQIAEVTLGMLYAWVLALPEFADDPELANDDLLQAILQEWLEESIAHD